MTDLADMQIAELLLHARDRLVGAGVDQAEIDAQLLLGYCLKKSRTQLILDADKNIAPQDCDRFFSFLRRRENREPVAYIVNEREFWSLPFYINESVLIPRPETEFLLEMVLAALAKDDSEISGVLDLCCGSGVIAIVLALELNADVVAVDCSVDALRVAEKNSRRHGVENRVSYVHSDLFEELNSSNKFSLIVSNPPYVSSGEIRDNLEPEVYRFEPHIALDGGADGLNIIRRIAQDALSYLSPQGMFFMEFGATQGAQIQEIFSRSSSGKRYYKNIKILQDYSGRNRVLFATLNTFEELRDGKADN